MRRDQTHVEIDAQCVRNPCAYPALAPPTPLARNEPVSTYPLDTIACASLAPSQRYPYEPQEYFDNQQRDRARYLTPRACLHTSSPRTYTLNTESNHAVQLSCSIAVRVPIETYKQRTTDATPNGGIPTLCTVHLAGSGPSADNGSTMWTTSYRAVLLAYCSPAVGPRRHRNP